ncbi:hypothetical protein SK128_025447 [Halocaridina rubra]|uniref:Uncharacterized protein n=1 Tax=Halocaridina rubra TaxID=373956 RepID=A0AAN8WH77_HALRR
MIPKFSFILSAAFLLTAGEVTEEPSLPISSKPLPVSNTSLPQTNKSDEELILQSSNASAITKNNSSSDGEVNPDYLKLRPLPAKGETAHTVSKQNDNQRHVQSPSVPTGRTGPLNYRKPVAVEDTSGTKVFTNRTHPQQRKPVPQEQRVTAQITVNRPRVFSRKILRNRIPQRRPAGGEQYTSGYHRKSRQEQNNERNGSSQFQNVGPQAQLESQRFQQPGEEEKSLEKDQFITASRTPVFDITRISTNKNSSSPVKFSNFRHINREKYAASAQPTDPVPSVVPVSRDTEEPRISKPSIAFHLGNTRRIPYQRINRNRTLHGRRLAQQVVPRTRPLIRYVRPNFNEHKGISTKTSIPESVQNSKNQTLNNGSGIPKPGPQQITVTNASSTVPNLQTSTHSLQKTIGNITLSLQHARELFARAQERYKATSENNSSFVNISEVINEPEKDPDRQYSTSYTKIRQSDGSVTHLDIITSSTTTQVPKIIPPITSSLETGNNSTETDLTYSTTSGFTTTPIPLEQVDTITADKQNISSTEQVNSNLPENQDDGSFTNISIPITSTLPPPVYTNSQFSLTPQGSLQNFTPFSSGISPNHQNFAGLYQQTGSSLPSGSNSQPLGLSNLFGLGGLPTFGSSLGGLSSLGLGQGFGSLSGGASQNDQTSSTGLNGGYLGLLSSLSGLGLGGSSSNPELALPSLQESSGSQSNTGLSFLSGLPSLSLSGLGNLGSLSSLGSLPSLSNLGGGSGSSGSNLGSLSGIGLSGLGFTGTGGVGRFGSGTRGNLQGFGLPESPSLISPNSESSGTNFGSILSKLTPAQSLAPVLSQPEGSPSSIVQSPSNVEDTLSAIQSPAILPTGNTKTADVASDVITK